ncbi:MAG: FadR family transcriptional regulator [Gemmataceae bacterium]|nr:FadR family transcriptional regulator [Gemmataceae bacterium]
MIPIEPIAKNSLVDTVVERIRSLIEKGELKAGDRLPTESELVERLQVSRGALREGIKRLQTLGLLRVAQGRGMYVGDGQDLSSCVQLFRSAMAISTKESLQFAEFRRMVECYNARRAAERATKEDVAELERMLEEKNRLGPTEEGVHWDWLFHRKLAEITGNDLIRNVVVVLQEFVVAGIWHTAQAPEVMDIHRRSYRLHRAIVDAIADGDPDAAERAMQTHMDALVSTLEKAEAAQRPAPRSRSRRGVPVPSDT